MERLNQWLTLIANLGVIAGLIFLIFEVDQTNNMMRAQTRSGISDAIIENITLGIEPRILSAYLKQESGEALSREEAHLLDQLTNATLGLWENTHYQYRNGLFDTDEFEADLEVWREEMQSPEFKRHWQARSATYSRSFRAEIDKLIE